MIKLKVLKDYIGVDKNGNPITKRITVRESGVWAIHYKGFEINETTTYKKGTEAEHRHYNKVLFVNKHKGEKRVEKLNEEFNCQDFTLVQLGNDDE